ncbi:hypothetical protein ASZ90_011247 [hydrocarbon metagenome]|uniref:Uncharacterized protein n=1 Tax=hydrocarbon metagenome TaxID=938273 RepID=A0A0W8FEK2_9ZZZZ
MDQRIAFLFIIHPMEKEKGRIAPSAGPKEKTYIKYGITTTYEVAL